MASGTARKKVFRKFPLSRPSELRFARSLLLLIILFAAAGAIFPISVSAQEKKPSPLPAPQTQEENLGGQEVEITKPVIWSTREEYYNLQGDAWNNLLLIRADRVVLRKSPVTRRRGSILRMDVPLSVNNNGQSTQAGLGDIYAQAILIPYFSRKFAFGAGSGLALPTPTHVRLGTGQWTASPLAAPLSPRLS